YPPNSHDQVEITAKDMECLDEGEFLNDSIVNFYLRWITLNAMAPEYREKIHIMNTFFYTKYTSLPVRDVAGRYAGMRNWTKRVDIFDKDYFVIPINDHLHWSVAIVCFSKKWADMYIS